MGRWTRWHGGRADDRVGVRRAKAICSRGSALTGRLASALSLLLLAVATL